MTKGYEARPTGVAGLAAELKQMRAEIDRLRQKVVSLSAPDSIIGEWITSGIATAAAGFSVISQRGVIRAGIVLLQLRISRTGSTITASPSGDIANTTMVTVDLDWRPDFGVYQHLGAATLPQLTDDQAWNTTIGTSGELQITSCTVPNGTIANGNELRTFVQWPLG